MQNLKFKTQEEEEEGEEKNQKRKLNKLRDSILTQLSALNPSKTISNDVVSLIDQRLLHHAFPLLHTPTHLPYACMIRKAISDLNEEGGSTEEAISQFIKREYEGLPWAHACLLSHHLRKLCGNREIVIMGNRRYKLPGEYGNFQDDEKMLQGSERRHGRGSPHGCIDRVESLMEQEEDIGKESQSKEEEIEERHVGVVGNCDGVKGHLIEDSGEQSKNKQVQAHWNKTEAFEEKRKGEGGEIEVTEEENRAQQQIGMAKEQSEANQLQLAVIVGQSQPKEESQLEVGAIKLGLCHNDEGNGGNSMVVVTCNRDENESSKPEVQKQWQSENPCGGRKLILVCGLRAQQQP